MESLEKKLEAMCLLSDAIESMKRKMIKIDADYTVPYMVKQSKLGEMRKWLRETQHVLCVIMKTYDSEKKRAHV
jgi:hypothetical protein